MFAAAAQCERGGRVRLDRAETVAFDARHLDQSLDGVAGHAQVMFYAISAAFSTWQGILPRTARRPAAAIAAAAPTSP